MARIDTTISGRISLPTGIKVVGTPVTAVTLAGEPVKTIYADPEGRYTIPGLPPGEYIVGVNADLHGVPVGIDRPFLPTYAPGTTDREAAQRITLVGPAAVAGVDINVEAADIASIRLHATLEDGRPAQEAGFEISVHGYGSRGLGKTDANGVAQLRIVKGAPVYLLGGASVGCLLPVPLGPDAYPESIEAVLRPDGCREQFNLGQLGMLEASARKAMGRMPVRVTFPDGTPAYKAQVSIVNHSSKPYSAGFQADSDGRIDLPAPLQDEFIIHASLFEGGRSCVSEHVTVNTRRDGMPTAETALQLKGATCAAP